MANPPTDLDRIQSAWAFLQDFVNTYLWGYWQRAAAALSRIAQLRPPTPPA